jgi:DNA-binding MarR family transcriptional regulator
VTEARARRTANLLGALALGISDRVGEAVAPRAGHSESTGAALSSVDQFLDQPSVDLLSRVVGLSQSGTVRLVDRLERDGWVRRGSGADGRTTTVSLTSAGRREALRLEASRLDVLDGLLEPLTKSEQETLAMLVGRILVGMMREPGATRWMCRLCDLSACGRPAGHCPIEQEARARYG